MQSPLDRPLVVVVGLGPAGEELLTKQALAELDAERPLYLRTARHPAAVSLLARKAVPLDHHYETAESFEDAYHAIVEELVDAAVGAGEITYAVPGSPTTGEATVALLRADPRVQVRVVAGLSFCDLAFERLAIDPLAARVRLVDGASFLKEAAGETGALLVCQVWSRSILSEMKAALDAPSGQRAVLLHHLGLPDEVVVEVALEDLDRTLSPDHLTAVYLPEVRRPVNYELARLIEVVSELRRRCPWDAEQTHSSLARHLLEETYETLEAIEELDTADGAAEHLEEELGDVLCQVLYHSVIASELGSFSLAEVAEHACDKLIARHPHVFAGRADLDSAERVVAAWEELKRAEKGRESVMEGIPSALPALLYATKLERKARAGGLGMEHDGELACWAERFEDLDASDEVQLGTALFALARLGAAAGSDPEEALRRVAGRFRARFMAAEATARAKGKSLGELDESERTALFNKASG